jgi:hypothetical protein
MDHFTVQDSQTPGDATFHVNQSSFAMKWRQELQAMHPDKVHLLVWLTHWRDGFGPNRTKNNRKSAVAWTASFSTPKGRINSIDNTRLIALGLKKNEAWPDVEHKFEEDMRLFGNGLKPFMVYHGGLKKIIPVFVRQFACLTDKVERSDITQTLGCTSTIHRQFGQILPIEEAPIVDTKAIQKFLKDMKMGLGKPRQYNWSSSMLSCNGVSEVLPACTICRKNNVDWLRREPSQRDPAIERCENCANWKVSSVTEARLRYAAPPNYPNQSRTMPSLPDGVVAPHGREPSPLLPPTPEGAETPIHYLLPIHCDFKTLRDGTRFCFFNAMAKNTIGWNQEISKSYLRSLGINEAQASLVYKAAQKAYNEKKAAEEAGQEPKDIDWKDPYYVGDYRFPAAWVGDLPIPNYIELLMHLMFLGIASSSFDQCTAFLKEQKKLVPFKKHSNELLKILNGFNLSWLLAYPFGGTKLTTGAWVSENWLAWVRVSTICCAFVGHEGVEDEKKGCNDVLRMVTCLQALVANVMSHAGSTSESTRLVDSLAREFLSAVRELDVRITNGKGSQSTWTKPNYASLVNLIACMILLGPLTNFWDGGGKGERYIQEIKPHIPRGVREGFLFLVRILQMVYKMDCISLIEKTLFGKGDNDDDSELSSVPEMDVLEDEDNGVEDDGVLEGMEIELPNVIEELTETNLDTDLDTDEGEYTTPMEADQMLKARTFHIYKNVEAIELSIARNEPICFIAVGKHGVPDLFVVHRVKQSKLLGWKQIKFVDTDGLSVCGIWYATLTMSDTEVPPPRTIKDVSKLADLSAVAIPLRYGVGENFMVPHQAKCCVITQAWRLRTCHGRFQFPSLLFELYEDC